MKYALFAMVLLTLQIEVAGQPVDSSPKTNIEKFQNRTSSLILKEYIDIPATRTVSIQVVKLTLLPERKESMSGVVISWGTNLVGIHQETGRAHLDADEIDGVIKSMDSMLKMMTEPMSPNYTELEFSTKAGLKLTLFPTKNAWNIAMERQGHRQFIFAEDLGKIQESLTAAKAKM